MGPTYFFVNSIGNITGKPYGSSTLPHPKIDLMKVVRKASGSEIGWRSPPPVAAHPIQPVPSRYQGVYPVKFNQDRQQSRQAENQFGPRPRPIAVEWYVWPGRWNWQPPLLRSLTSSSPVTSTSSTGWPSPFSSLIAILSSNLTAEDLHWAE